MKRLVFVFVSLLFLAVSLQQCKPDPVECTNCNADPDSLYVGVPVTLTKPFQFPAIKLAPGVNLTEEGILLGRMLFYDPVLSNDSTISCASCHKQEFAFSDGGKQFSQNVFGPTVRNTPALFNLVWMQKFFWDGRSDSLHLQALDAMLHEQNFNEPTVLPKLQAKPEYVRLFKKAFGRPGTITREGISKALEMFMFTLISADSKFDKVKRGQDVFTEQEQRGLTLFTTDIRAVSDTIDGADCFHCHAGPGLTMIDNQFHNNALDESSSFAGFPDLGLGKINGNQLDNGKFKTPHIRNIEVTGPYMRDGRFATLSEVVDFYNSGLKQSPTVDPLMKTVHQGGLQTLTGADKDAMIAFLRTLTDTAFLHNPAHSNPFK